MEIVDIPVRAEIPRDGYDRPLVVPKEGGKPVPLYRTTTFIDCIEDKSNIADWKARSVLVGAAKDPSLIEQATGLDVRDDKDALMVLVEKALVAAGAHDRREKGTYLHALSELQDEQMPMPASATDIDLRDMEAYRETTSGLTMLEMEQFVVCSQLQVGGTFDRTLRYTGPGPLPLQTFEDETLIGDLKTGTTAYGQLKIAAQLAIYSRGERYDFSRFPVPELTKRHKRGTPEEDWKKRVDMFKKTEFTPEEAAAAYSPLGNVNQEWGVVINVESGSGEGKLLWADLQLGWRMALLAQVIRQARAEKGALRPWATGASAGVIRL